MIVQRLVSPLIALAVALWPMVGAAQPASDSQSNESGAPTGLEEVIVYADGGRLHGVASADRKSRSFELVHTGSASVKNFDVRGRTALIDTGTQLLRARLPDISSAQPPFAAVQGVPLQCRSPARISPSGARIACTSESGELRVYAVQADAAQPVASPSGARGGAATFAGERLLTQRDAKLWSHELASDSEAQVIAPVAPADHLLASPDGRRAVGWFPVAVRGKQVQALHAFRLDGRAVRRRLMKRAIPVDWSRDNRWLLVQRGKRACLVRAVGGHYKCWRGFRALAISARGERLLLGRFVEPGAGEDSPDTWRVKGYQGERGIVAVRDEPDIDSDSGARPEPQVPQMLRVYSVATDGVQPSRPKVVLSGIAGPARYLFAPSH